MFPHIPNVIVPLALAKLLYGTGNAVLCAGLFTVSVAGFEFFANTPMHLLLTKAAIAFVGAFVFYTILKKLKDMPLFWPVAIAGSIALGYIG